MGGVAAQCEKPNGLQLWLVEKVFKAGKSGVELVDWLVEGEFEGANELDHVAAEAFFEAVDAVAGGFGVGGEAAEAVEVVALEAVFGGVF